MGGAGLGKRMERGREREGGEVEWREKLLLSYCRLRALLCHWVFSPCFHHKRLLVTLSKG